MGYSKKAKVENNYSESSRKVDWAEYNDHLLKVISKATDGGAEPNQVCIISGIVDSGLQNSEDPFKEYDWEDSERQQKLLAADFGCYVDEERKKFCIPNEPCDTVLFFVDFPAIMVNYGKFFSEDGKDDYRPYRTLLAGDWDGMAVVTTLLPDPKEGYGPKSRINKLAHATGTYREGNPPANFEIGDLLGKALTMDITAHKNGEFVNVHCKNPASKHKAIPIPEHNIVPFGISFDGGNDVDALNQIKNKKAIRVRLEAATNWEGSGLKKDLEALSEAHTSPKSDDKPSGNGKVAGKAKPSPKAQPEPLNSTEDSEGVSLDEAFDGDDTLF